MLIKPLGEEYFLSHIQRWSNRYAADEDVFNLEIFPYFIKTFTLFDYNDYSDKIFHGYGPYKYFNVFQNGAEIKQIFEIHSLDVLHNFIQQWHKDTYNLS